MYGGKVRNKQSSVQLVLRDTQFSCIYDNGKRCGHTLITAARVYNNRHLAAVHTGVRACRRPSLGAVVYGIAVGHKQSSADSGAVLALKTLFGNSGIIFYLSVKRGLNTIKIYGLGKVYNIFNCQYRVVYIAYSFLDLLFKNGFTVKGNEAKSCMMLYGRGVSYVIFALYGNTDVKNTVGYCFLYGDRCFFYKFGYRLFFIITYSR